jgi:enoyl-CoA hydratase/carnithine racemase
MSHVRAETHGHLGLITLDRPQALNALTADMCAAIHAALDGFVAEPNIKAVAIEGAGERAFCAGGDVVTMHRDGRAGSDGWERFFATEYAMNAAIASYPKPYVALIDGITMGGGVGVSIHGRYRVATERTLWAMPETGIGMMTDVGTSYALPRLDGKLGLFLALTGARLDGPECRYANIATHFTHAARLGELKAMLADGVEPQIALDQIAEPPHQARLAQNRDAIDTLFAGENVEGILAALEADGGEWAAKEAATLKRMSPTALKVVFEGLRRGAEATSVAEALRTEYRVVAHMKATHDFYEGVRAQLIDKDRSPKWQPATLAEVSTADVAAHFAEPAGGDLRLG